VFLKACFLTPLSLEGGIILSPDAAVALFLDREHEKVENSGGLFAKVHEC